jgi:phosphoribosylaminoimidazole (AIR) synthetase
MQVLNQQTDTDFFAEPVVHSIELQLAILKEYMTKAANNGVGMHELLAVKEQNDLIKAVKQKLSVTVKKLPSITEPDESDQSKGRLLTETSINKRSIQKEVISSKNRLSTQGS